MDLLRSVVAGKGLRRLGTADARDGGGRGEEQMEKEVAIVDWVVLWLREEKGKRQGWRRRFGP